MQAQASLVKRERERERKLTPDVCSAREYFTNVRAPMFSVSCIAPEKPIITAHRSDGAERRNGTGKMLNKLRKIGEETN